MEHETWDEERKERERNEQLKGALLGQRIAGLKGDTWDNHAIARDIVHNELGYTGNRRPPYNLDQDTRDILLVHARQDAAHALANTVSLLKVVRTLKLATFGIAALLLAVALHLWQLI